MAFVKVAKASDVAPGTMNGYVAGDKKVAIANANGKLFAFEDKCPASRSKAVDRLTARQRRHV